MANHNTIAAVVNNPSQTINSTSETLLKNAAGTALVLSVPPDRGFKQGHTFRVRVVGTANGGTAATLQFKLYLGTSLSGSVLAAFTVSGVAVPVGGGNFSLDADLTWDGASGVINGAFSGQTNNTLTTRTAVTQATGITSTAALNFAISATFGAALATNQVTVTEFTLEQV
jgi:hypothetical protein